MEIFVQKEGSSPGNEVEVVKENGNEVVLCSLATGFIYSVSLRDFNKMYGRKEDVGDNSDK